MTHRKRQKQNSHNYQTKNTTGKATAMIDPQPLRSIEVAPPGCQNCGHARSDHDSNMDERGEYFWCNGGNGNCECGRYVDVDVIRRYCPKCEGEVQPTDARWSLFDCATCETVLFESEVDEWPGQTKGKAQDGG